MPTTYVSASHWSQSIPVTANGAFPVMVPTHAPKMGIGVDTTGGSVTIESTLGTPTQVSNDTCTWSPVPVTGGEATVDMPISALKVTVAGGATGEIVLIQ